MSLSSRSPSHTSPLVGLSSAASMFSSVVFPEPLSPMMATYSPSSTEKETLESACTWWPPKRVAYTFLRLFALRIVILQKPP